MIYFYSPKSFLAVPTKTASVSFDKDLVKGGLLRNNESQVDGFTFKAQNISLKNKMQEQYNFICDSLIVRNCDLRIWPGTHKGKMGWWTPGIRKKD